MFSTTRSRARKLLFNWIEIGICMLAAMGTLEIGATEGFTKFSATAIPNGLVVIPQSDAMLVHNLFFAAFKSTGAKKMVIFHNFRTMTWKTCSHDPTPHPLLKALQGAPEPLDSAPVVASQ